MLHRSGAKAGDLVFVTGTIGDAAGGLAIAKGDGKGIPGAVRTHLLQRFRIPHPRTSLGPLLLGIANSALDVSDGLVADLGHISETSKVRIVINAPSVPHSAALHALWGDDVDAILRAITGGDDYEIAFTAPASAAKKLMRASAKTGVPVTKIGHVERGRGVIVRDAAGKTLDPGAPGWTHF
jgi:thiamine-monophosphate kinase